MAIAPESLPLFKSFCERERCPFAVIGVATEERQLQLVDEGQESPVDMPMDVLLGKPPKMHRDVTTCRASVACHGLDGCVSATSGDRCAEPPHSGFETLFDHHRRPRRGRPHAP